MIGQDGVLVPADDPVQLRQALEMLAHNPDQRAQLGKGAAARAMAHFTPKIAAARLAEEYRKLTAPTSPPSAIVGKMQ